MCYSSPYWLEDSNQDGVMWYLLNVGVSRMTLVNKKDYEVKTPPGQKMLSDAKSSVGHLLVINRNSKFVKTMKAVA